MGDVVINFPQSESKSRLKCSIINQLKRNDVSCNTILDERTWRQREITKYCLYFLIFLARPIHYYSSNKYDNIFPDYIADNIFQDYIAWLDILLFIVLAVAPFGITMWLSYKPSFIQKVFPWTFCSESLLLLLIVLRDKIIVKLSFMHWTSVISYFLVQIYSFHNIIYMIPVENLVFLIIYLIVYNDSVFNKFYITEPIHFFPIYLIFITCAEISRKIDLQKGGDSSNKLIINTNVKKDYDQCNTPAEKALYICRVIMETPQIEQQDLSLLDRFQASLLEKLMKETNAITEKKTKNIVEKYSIENTAVIDGNEFNDQCDTPKIEVVDSEILNKYFSDIESWDWNIFEYAKAVNNPLYYLTRYFFEKENLFNLLNIPEKEFNRFIGLIEKGYHDLPFHNKIHATDVLHAMSYLTKNPKIKSMCNTIDIMCCYIAAIIHDYDHPGYSNIYLINIQDEMAILYNDQRVLENHHLAKAWELLLKPENNFLKNFERKDFLRIRKLIIELVLATDLSQHNQLLSSFSEKILKNENIDVNDESTKDLILKIIIKFADVSNPSKAWSIYTYWFERIMTEFYRQGDHEKEHGIKISDNMDRNNENAPLCQIKFIQYICEPINIAVDTYLQDKVFMNNLKYNFKRLNKLEEQKKIKLADKDFDVFYGESE